MSILPAPSLPTIPGRQQYKTFKPLIAGEAHLLQTGSSPALFKMPPPFPRTLNQPLEQENTMSKHVVVGFVIIMMTSAPVLAEPAYVIIDASKPHVTVYSSVKQALPGADFAKIKAAINSQTGASMETWESFKNNLSQHVSARIRKNDYPELPTREGLLAFLDKYDGVPIGLTWNGGIAFTYNDYMHTKRTYRAYLEEPDTVLRPSERKYDPTHPGNHFDALLPDSRDQIRAMK